MVPLSRLARQVAILLRQVCGIFAHGFHHRPSKCLAFKTPYEILMKPLQ